MVGVRYATPASQRAFSRALGQKSTRKYATTKDVEGKAPLKTLSTGARRAKLHNGGGVMETLVNVVRPSSLAANQQPGCGLRVKMQQCVALLDCIASFKTFLYHEEGAEVLNNLFSQQTSLAFFCFCYSLGAVLPSEARLASWQDLLRQLDKSSC